jgi:hypothetical protein
VSQKNHAQHGHAVFRRGELGVGAEIIGGIPEAGFKLGKIIHELRADDLHLSAPGK